MNNESTDSKPLGTSSTEAPTLHRRENSPDHSIRADGPVGQGGDANATIHDRTGLYLSIIALVFSAMSFGMAIMLPMIYQERTQNLADKVRTADQNAALAREDIRIMQIALAKHGIETDVHAEEKSK